MKGRIFAAFAVVYLVWGSTYLGIRWAVETLPPFLLSGTRFIVAGLLLYAWARIRGAPAPGRREWLAALGIGILLVAGGNAMVVWAEQRVPSGLAALIVAGMPLWVALFQRVAPGGKPIAGSRLIGLVVGFGGLALLLAGRGEGIGGVPLVRMGGLVLASVSWALGSVLSRRVPLPGDSPLASAMSMLAGGVVALGIGVAGNELAGLDPARVSAASIAAWAYLVVFGSMVAYLLHLAGERGRAYAGGHIRVRQPGRRAVPRVVARRRASRGPHSHRDAHHPARSGTGARPRRAPAPPPASTRRIRCLALFREWAGAGRHTR